MHLLKKKLWHELELIEKSEMDADTQAKSAGKDRLDIKMEHINAINAISQAYINVCKASKYHHEHSEMEKHEMDKEERHEMTGEPEMKPKIFG